MDLPQTTPLPRRIEEASRAIRCCWSHEERCTRRRAAPRRQLKLLRAVLASQGGAMDGARMTTPKVVSPFAVVG